MMHRISRREARRGAYFFVIDAFIGSIIIIATIVAVYSGFSYKEESSQVVYRAEDFLTVIDSTPISKYGYASGPINTMILDGTIADTRLTLLQQMVLFNIIHNTNASVMANDLIYNHTPSAVGITVIMNQNTLGTRNTSGGVDEKGASTVFVGQRIVLLRESAASLYPPAVVEVHTWQ
jgi:hypothetical protein